MDDDDAEYMNDVSSSISMPVMDHQLNPRSSNTLMMMRLEVTTIGAMTWKTNTTRPKVRCFAILGAPLF